MTYIIFISPFFCFLIISYIYEKMFLFEDNFLLYKDLLFLYITKNYGTYVLSIRNMYISFIYISTVGFKLSVGFQYS